MAKEAGKKSILDFFKDKNIDDDYEDEFDDDLFDDEAEEDDYYSMTKSKASFSKPKSPAPSNTRSFSERPTSRATESASYNVRPQTRTGAGNNKLVEFNGRKGIKSKMTGEVYVIQPKDIEDTDLIVDNLLDGYVIIINLEGVEISTAQRIVDFVGGATKAIDGSIVPITGNIFVATAYKDSVTGNLREDISGTNQLGYNY